MDTPFRYIRFAEVKKLSGLSRSNIFSRVAEGTFPAPTKLGERSSGWNSCLLQSWLDNPAGWRAEKKNDAGA